MSNYNGYFSLPRSLTRSKIWNDLSLKNQKIFIVLVDHACFKPQLFDDHGHVFELKAGQFCASYAEIKELCGKEIKIIDVERAIKKFILYGFLSQEVRYKKSIITILHKETYDLVKNNFEVRNEVNLRQTCGKLEVQRNNDNNDNNEKNELHIPRQALENKIIDIKSSEKKQKSLKASELAISLTEHFYFSLTTHVTTFKNSPSTPQKLNSEALHCDEILKTYSESDIKRCVNYAHANEFWKSHIYNTNKLKVKFGTLLTQAKQHEEKNEKSQGYNKSANGPKFKPKFVLDANEL